MSSERGYSSKRRFFLGLVLLSDKCGGHVVYTGSCQCEPPSINEFTCTGTH